MSRKKKRQRDHRQVEFMITVKGPVPHNCLCERPHAKIICRNCGESFRGRKRLHCPVHINIMFLNDMSQCPTCKASSECLLEYNT